MTVPSKTGRAGVVLNNSSPPGLVPARHPAQGLRDASGTPISLRAGLGVLLIVLRGPHEAGDDVLVGKAVLEGVHPRADLRGGRRPADVLLVVGADALALALGAGREAVGHLGRRHAAGQGPHPGVHLSLLGRAAQQVLVQTPHPAGPTAAVILDVLRRADETSLQPLVG